MGHAKKAGRRRKWSLTFSDAWSRSAGERWGACRWGRGPAWLVLALALANGLNDGLGAPDSPVPAVKVEKTGTNVTGDGEIVLDAVCDLNTPLSPPLAPGNPAPSTRRMAQR